MADALLLLSEALRSKTGEDKMTPSERQLIYNCLAKMTKNFFVGAAVSSALVYRATRRFGHWHSIFLSAGPALFVGNLVFNRSGNACLDQILNIEGSRMQRELADIILRNFWKNPSRMRLVQKHFYPEFVFTDLSPDKALVKLRARNIYLDGTASERIEDHSINEDDDNAETQSFGESTSNLDAVNTFQNDLDGDFLADPLDCIFGIQQQSQDICHSGGAETTRIVRHAHKRGRRHRA
ncbi:hypothetical protein KSP39_PZI015395 [Platanthera zijinensis]|uniref:Uncharacterized protein n=1 Tax=Platanthera zijinensis TaxID=2320716 RepID=A0AAP0B973_9ASPA